LYPTLLREQYSFSANDVTVTQVIANLGAMAGATASGYFSQIIGRRLTIIIIAVLGGALLYPYSFVSSKAVSAAAFFEQGCVLGIFGIAP
jgi:SHS family lactate transporter-like MFS transporter